MARTKQNNANKVASSSSKATKTLAMQHRRAVKEPMKPSRMKPHPKDLPLKKNGGKRLKERVVKEAKEEEDQHKQRIMRKGAGRRAVVRETADSINNIVSKIRFRRIIKAICQELGNNKVEVAPLFDNSKPFKGFKNGLTRGSRTRSGNLVIQPNEKLLRIQFGQNTLYTMQQVTEREMAKIVEHALQARVEQMSETEREEAQGHNIRIRPQQVEGAIFRYYEEKDPMTLTYFRHFASLLGKEVSVSASRVA
jgi:hypothetical protein